MTHPTLTFRPFETLEEYQACVDLQEEIWGIGFREQVSTAILMIANKLGGLAAGAFDKEGRIQGFVFGLTGLKEGRLVHWSDMLAVRVEFRDRGLGTRLKRYQREILLERGVELMHWTFDPLQGRNAFVNFAKLGITSREYVRNMYGDTDSPLHRVGTDRLVARWEMASARVKRRLAGEEVAPVLGDLEGSGEIPDGNGAATGGETAEARVSPPSRVLSWEMEGEFPRPGDADLTLEDPRLLLTIPAEVDTMMAADLGLAVRWREATREPFLHYLGRGWELKEFLRDRLVSHYLLVREANDVPSAEEGGKGGN